MQQGLSDPGIVGQQYKINSIYDLSPQALGELRSYLEQSGIAIPISQIVGFSQYQAEVATTINTVETTSSTSYTNLATTGPQITNLPAGKYLILFGAEALSNWVGTYQAAYMSVSKAGAAATDSDAVESTLQTRVSVSRAVLASFTAPSNSVVAKYKTSDAGASAEFSKRWMIALRYANA